MRIKLKKLIPFLVLFFLAILVFRNWFTFKPISAGDWEFLYSETIYSFSLVPFSWSFSQGLGINALITLGIGGYYRATALIAHQIFKIPWLVVEKIIWFWPFLILTIFSSWYLAKTLFPKSKIIRFSAPLIYLFNTYILMVVGGGQMGIAMAYAIAPLVLGLFAHLINESKGSRVQDFKRLVLAGLILAIQMTFDLRISFLTMAAIGLYCLFNIKNQASVIRYLALLAAPVAIAVLLHAYWLLPVILFRKTGLPFSLGEPGWVEFLSFADFSNSLSLLHPNWPENIFGKTYFMRPEFLILPILAFGSLLFINQLTRSRVKKLKNSLINNLLMTNKAALFFNLLALVGAFLAKGSKPPLGGVYLWLFDNFPGFNLFRDPTKFYLLVALSYSALIPFSLSQFPKIFKKPKIQLITDHLLLITFFLFWLFLIRPAWLGQLSGTFKTTEVPSEYLVFKDFIHNQKDFFRTLWLPKRQRFGFYSYNHPAIESPDLPSKEELATRSVKYVVAPLDSEGEIFLEDRKYDHQQRLALEEELDKIDWLKKLDLTDKVAIYETPNYQDHFFIIDGNGVSLGWGMINPTKYTVSLKTEKPVTLVFSEAYDELWQAKIGKEKVFSKEYKGLNSFLIDQAGDFEILVQYLPQKYVYWGLIISATTLVSGLFYLAWRG